MTGDDHTDSLQTQLLQMEQRKDAAYLERNCCVALIARMALAMGWPAGTARTAIEGWSEDWHGCVYIDLPTGQASWHYHDSQAHLFSDLPAYTRAWDGHDTPEKYRRVARAFEGGRPSFLMNQLSRLEMQAGDVAVLQCDRPLTGDQRKMLRDIATITFGPGVKTMVLDAGLRLGVVAPPPVAAQPTGKTEGPSR